jgi:hypothetical protein
VLLSLYFTSIAHNEFGSKFYFEDLLSLLVRATSTILRCIMYFRSVATCASLYLKVVYNMGVSNEPSLRCWASQEYATRTDTHYMLHVPYAAIARVIREGKLEMHLIDNKIQINVAEARTVFSKGSHLFE